MSRLDGFDRPGSTAAIDVVGATVHYDDLLALDQVDLQLAAGRICGLIGANGSGKSTLFKVIMGALRPDTGAVRLVGLDPARARKRGTVGYVPQSEEIDRRFPISVGQVAMMGRYGRLGWTRTPRAEDRRAVAEALQRVRLSDLVDRPIGQLSGGQRKRAFVARGLASQAPVLLLDEPFAGVDRHSEDVMTAVLREHADAGGTVLISTHDLQGLPRLADEAVLIRRRVLSHGPVADVLRPELLAEAFGLSADPTPVEDVPELAVAP